MSFGGTRYSAERHSWLLNLSLGVKQLVVNSANSSFCMKIRWWSQWPKWHVPSSQYQNYASTTLSLCCILWHEYVHMRHHKTVISIVVQVNRSEVDIKR